jgi:15-cis-phytoene synthase
LSFKKETLSALKGKPSNNKLIQDFVDLSNKNDFDESWIRSFLECMEFDLGRVQCKTIKDTEKYMYGSAEVVGLFMCKLMNLNKDAYDYAMILGRAMQYINFIRDIKEDAERGRAYFPLDEAKNFGLKNLDLETIVNNKESFSKFLRFQIKRFYDYDVEARKGFKFIPKRFLIPIMTAQDMAVWTAKQIEKNPLIVLNKKVKPRTCFIVFTVLRNFLR